MDVQGKKEYLYRYKVLEGAISRKQEERDKLLTMCEKSTTTLSDAPRGGESSREDMYIKLADMDELIQDMRQQRSRLFKEIMCRLETLNNKTMQDVLGYRYLNGMSERAIARKIKKSRFCIRQVHDKALEKLFIEGDG